MQAMRLDSHPRGPEKPPQGRIRPVPASRLRRLRVSRWSASGNVRRYDGTASSGSVVANDPINSIDPTGEQDAKFDRMAEELSRQRERDFQAAENTYNADDPTNGDNHLSLGEANRHYRQGEGAPVDVDASKLTYIPDKQATEAGDTVSGRIEGLEPGGDYWVHGRNNATLQSDGTYRLVDGPYDFDIKGGLREVPRDFGARVGEDVATRGGRNPGQPFVIRYHGAPRVRVP
jgi:hypothetical protein